MTLFSKIALAFTQGGNWMWGLLILNILAFAIIVERLIALYLKYHTGELEFAKEFEMSIRRGDLEGVVDVARTAEKDHPLAKAICAGAQAAQNFGGRDEIQGKMDEALLVEHSKLERRTGFLAMLANVATLTGLLGTITGMIKSFAAVAYANPMEKAAMLSSGISEAMNCTAYGLVIAIPSLVLYAVLMNRSNTLREDLNQGALKIFNWLSYTYEPVAFRTKTQQTPASRSSTNSEVQV